MLTRALALDKAKTLMHCPSHLMPINALSGEKVTRWGSPGTKRSPDERGSAVLVLLSPLQTISPDSGALETNDLFLTLTMRSSRLKSHAGQMSFPGGRCDRVEDGRWETAIEAAVREGEEEVGLRPGTYTVLGELSPIWSIPSKSWVTPVVALGLEGNPSHVREGSTILPPLAHADAHNASPDEVESLHYISIKGLLNDSTKTHHQQVVHYSPVPDAPKIPLLMPCFFADNVSPIDASKTTMDGYSLPTVADYAPAGVPSEMQPWCESDSPYFALRPDGSNLLKLVDKESFEGVSLTWGMTAFMVAELACRLSVSLNLPDTPLVDLDAELIERASEGLPARLTPSGLVLRDADHPRGVPRATKPRTPPPSS